MKSWKKPVVNELSVEFTLCHSSGDSVATIDWNWSGWGSWGNWGNWGNRGRGRGRGRGRR